MESDSAKEGPLEAGGGEGGGGGGPQTLAKTPKTGFDKLSHEELVTKCKQLLNIAQKAKHAKDEALADAQNVRKELKDVVLNLKKTEEARKIVSEEAGAFRDMVNDLTEGKVALTTKNESLQRQLKLLTSEVDSLRSDGERLLKNKAALEEQLKNLRSSTSEHHSLARGWQKEKEHLMEQIESLTAKCTQVDVLKQKCKNLMQEKSDLEAKIEASGASTAELRKIEAQHQMLVMEKQAMDIVVKESQNQRKVLEDKVKSLEKEKSELENYKQLENKVAELESQIRELENINKSLTDENRCLAEEKQLNCILKEQVEGLGKEKEEEERKARVVKEEKNKLEEDMIGIQKELEFLKKEKSNFESQCKLNGEREDVYMKEQLLAFEAKEKAFQKEKEFLCDQLKEKEIEVQNEKEGRKTLVEEYQQEVQEMQRQIEKLQQEHQKLLALKDKEVQKALLLSKENEKILNDHRQLGSDLSCVKENLAGILKEKEALEVEVAKSKATAESYHNKIKGEDKKMEEYEEKVENLSKNIEAKSEELRKQISERQKVENALKNFDNKAQMIWSQFQSAFSSLTVNVQGLNENETALAYLQNMECILEKILAKQSQTDLDNRIEEICMLTDKCFVNLSKLLKGETVEEQSLVQLGAKFADSISVLYEGWLNVNENEGTYKSKLHHAFKVVPDLSKSIQDLHQNLKLRESCIQEKEVQLNECESKLNEYEDSLKKLNEQIVNLETKLAKEEEIRQKLEAARVEETESKGSLEEEIVKYSKQMDNLKTMNNTLEKEKEECDNQITSLKDELAQASKQIQSLDSEKKTVISDNERLVEEMFAIKKNMDSTSEDKDKIITDIQEENRKMRKDVIHRSEEKTLLEERIKEMKQENQAIEETLSQTTQSKSDLETKVAELIQFQNEYESLKGNLSKSSQEKNRLEEELVELKKLHLKQKEELEARNIELLKKNAEIDEFRNESAMMKKAQELVEQKIEEQQQEIEKIECRLQDAQKQIEILDAEKTTCEKSLKEAQNVKEQLEASLQTSSIRCQELLTELNDMNSVLRERGERISRLEVTSKEKDEQLKDLKIELADSKKMIAKIAEDSAKKEVMCDVSKTNENNSEDCRLLRNQIVNLEEEKENLKRTIKGLEKELATGSGGGSHDTQSEVMSTSTISRMEESQRMKDLDDTFEERFMKMKSIAIRLKKKVAELTAQLNTSEESRKKLNVEREETKKRLDAASKDKENLKALTKNIQVLQGEIDRLQDQVDSKAKDLKEQDKQLVAVGQQLADAKLQVANMQEENDQLKRTVMNLEETIKEQAEASENVRGQVAALEKRLHAEADQREALEERRKKTDERVEEERTKREQLMKDLEEAKQDSKKSSLMDLEIRDYERTVAELTATLAEKDKDLITLQNSLEHEKEHINSLKDQITHLSTQEATERERAEKMKKLLLDHKSQLAELKFSQEKHFAEQEASRSTIEQLTQEVEKQKLALAEVSAEKSRLEDYGRRIKTTGERQVEVLEEQAHQQREEIDQLNNQLKAVKEEFEGFKVRAHSVLRQKSKPQELNIDEVKAEKEQLQSELEAARLKIQQLQTEFAALRAEHGFLQAERDRSSKQVSSLSSQLTKMEGAHHEKVLSLESNMVQKSSEYQQIICNMTSQNEMMSNSYKNQLASLKLCHTKEIEQLQLRVEELEDKLWEAKNSSRTPPTTGTPSVPQQVPHEGSTNHRRQPSHGCEEPRMDISNMIREEGEGSEWVEPVPPSAVATGGTGAGHDRRYSPPPLDQLLSNPLQPLSRSVSVDDNTSLHSLATDITATTKDTSHLEAKISSYEIRVKQLTSLLHESEGENAKLQQLAEALKEEIRRSTRNEDRQKHLESTEYLKNVVLKFLVLRNSDEKKRLIPVLTTVLQLSPQEAGELQDLIADENTATEGSQGWGSYLHLWSGGAR